jgi:hypothetical protein
MRTGQCIECGACCRLLGFWVDLTIPDIIEWLAARGVEIRGDMAVFEHPCPHLVMKFDGRGGKGKPACDLHGDDKPEVCKRFPEEPGQVLEGCGFGFLEEEVSPPM